MIKVNAGPDDFAFERDRYLWRMWIKDNITLTGFMVNADRTDAYKAIVTFEDPKWETFFILKAPEYINESLVQRREEWLLGVSGP